MRVLILGSKSLCVRLIERFLSIAPGSIAAIVTFDDSSDSRTALTTLLELGRRSEIPVTVARDRGHAESVIAATQPDLCFVANWYWLLSDACLGGVRHGFVGVHYSKLPEYRGTSPVVWQILNGEQEVGFSIFSLSSGMDEGDLWAQGAVPLTPSKCVGDALMDLEIAVGSAFDALYPALLDGSARSFAQPLTTPTYCAARLADDGIIDFTQTARRCHDFIRAQSHPYPGAFTMFQGERLVIWRAHPLDVTYYGRPGQVVRVASTGVTVICGDNRPIIVTDVGWRGAEVGAAEVIRSVKTRLPSVAPAI